MNWSKIKNIMIMFLIAMNIAMLAFIAMTSMRDAAVPEDVITSSLAVMQRDGFECDRDVFPSKRYTLPRLSAKFFSASELSELFFSKQLAFRTVDDSLVAREDKATLTVSKNHFLYKSGYEADTSHSAKKVRRALRKAGINMSGSVYDKKEDCFYFMYKDVNLFNMYISAKLDSDGELCYVSAQWPSKLSALEDKELSFTSVITKLSPAFPDGGRVKAIERGYALHSSGSKFFFTPSWRVNVDGNSQIIE